MTPLDTLCINTMRILSAEAVQKARSGHPGMPMGAAALGYVLWTRFLKHNPHNPAWPDRDRFILSAGHGSMLLYSLLHLTGYDLSLDEIRNFRQWGSRTAGHPEFDLTPGVEVTTGPLGQGFAHGVGMAMAERYLAQQFNQSGHTIVDHYTYAIVGDGDLMEGLSHEAASLAGHLKLGKMIYLFDDNRITIEGQTSLATSDDIRKRFEAYGWEVYEVDGNDIEALTSAIERGRDNQNQPSLIAARTHIGHGSPHKQDSQDAHGAPLGEDEIRLTKEALGWPHESNFFIPTEVADHFRTAVPRGRQWEDDWKQRMAAYGQACPEKKDLWDLWQARGLPAGWQAELWKADPGPDPAATRSVSGLAIRALSKSLGNLVGGSADLGPSNNTVIKGSGAFGPGSVDGPNIHFGVREHAMAAAAGGMALHGGIRPYAGTFLVFSDYMRPSLRLAALMGAAVVYVFTHDSIGLGEDGPTHQPIEHLASLRAIPDLTVIRPADARETLEAWWVAIRRSAPVALILTRQKVASLSRDRQHLPAESTRAWCDPSIPPTARGAYVISETGNNPDLILIGTGSELHLCIEAQTRLEAQGIRARVVSMPSWELFEEQSQAYREFVLPPATRVRLAVEMAVPMGWERYTGRPDAVIGIPRFGASAPASILFQRFGFTPENVVSKALNLLSTSERPAVARAQT
ncbi:MAG: transketolase [Candidatus Eisenbacteria sp.]|nr:transketolase [Candidatus Eisenbacteria bacterium]